MSNKHIKSIQFVYKILLSILLIVAGACFIAASMHIYFTGEGIYTRAIVAEHFAAIAIPVYLCVAMIVVGLLLNWLLPNVGKGGFTPQTYMVLSNAKKRRDLAQGDAAVVEQIKQHQRRRRTNAIIGWILLVAGSVIFLSYGCNGANFHSSEITSSMISAMWVLLPCMAVPFLWAVYAAFHAKESMQVELSLWRKLPMSDAVAEEMKAHSFCWLKALIVVAAVALIIFGFVTGGTADVLTKAINICTECVGLG